MNCYRIRGTVRLLSLAAIVICASAWSGAGIAAGQDSKTVDAAARSFIVAFNSLDMPSFLEHFTDDATMIHPPSGPPRTFPTRLQGKREIERTFQVVFDQIRKGSGKQSPPYQNLQPRDLLIQQFDGFAVLTFHLGTETRIGRRTLVYRQVGSEWKVVHLHASTFEVDVKP